MCRRWQLEVTMILDIRKEKQHLTNYKIHGTDYPKQSFEVQACGTIILIIYESETY